MLSDTISLGCETVQEASRDGGVHGCGRVMSNPKRSMFDELVDDVNHCLLCQGIGHEPCLGGTVLRLSGHTP